MIISVLFLITGIWLFVIIGGIKYMHIFKLVFVFLSIPLAIIGFKKHKYGLALVALVLIVGAYGLAEMSRTKPFIPATVILPADNKSLFPAGQLVYMQNCVFCHGTDGKKMYRNAPDLTLSKSSESAIAQLVREGSKGKMPSYIVYISDENIAAVAKYVNSMHEPATPLNN
jgi:mono/diheme cytochrome c family protein